MDKGQHLRLVIMSTASTPQHQFVALATELTAHFSAQTEDSTTKDTTDVSGGNWNSYDVTGRSGDIQFTALVASLTGDYTDDDGLYLDDFIQMVNDTPVNWKLVLITPESTKNRTISKTICTGQGKLTNLQISAQNRQQTTYSGTLNMFGPVTVGSD